MFRRTRHHGVEPTTAAPFDLWGAGTWCNQEVVGESAYLPALRRLLPNTENRTEIETAALLVPEQPNPHDSNAVIVRIDDATVGYLPRDVASKYQPMLLSLGTSNRVARVACRIWGDHFSDYELDSQGDYVERERFNASVTVALAEPHMCLPVNGSPSVPHVLLPDGGSIQITGEDQHMPAIEPILRPEGECYVYATLHEIEEPAGRVAKTLVEVRINEHVIGRLTPKMSGDLLPAIRYLDARQLVTVAKAKVTGNRLKAEVVLHCARAHQLPADWPGDLVAIESAVPITAPEADRMATSTGPAADPNAARVAMPPRPEVNFSVPPGWPTPPQGWEPPPGWHPDRSWPPPPDGWTFWVLDDQQR